MTDWLLYFAVPLFLVSLIGLSLFLVLAVALLMAGINPAIDWMQARGGR